MIEIRSYRRVFDLERRIYSVDRLRLNPTGVPVRGILYFLVAVAIGVILTPLPVVGVPLRAVPWYADYVLAPGVLATVLGAIRIEGRTFHLAARSMLGHAVGAHWLAGLKRGARPGARWRLNELLLLPDGSDSRLRRMRYIGPGAVLVAVGHAREGPALRLGAGGGPRRGLKLRLGPALRLRPDGGSESAPEVIVLRQGASLSVHSGSGEGR
jgi:hypothetical protein